MTGATMQAINLQRDWTSKKALILVGLCLALGISAGWLIRGVQSPAKPATIQARIPVPAAGISTASANVAPQPPNPARLRQMADTQAAPLLAKLNANPKDPDTLSTLGNLYYDARQYPVAIDYYNRALQSRPSDASVRTDMATAYWYLGNADQAIAEFKTALTFAPSNPNTLFNLGIVKWEAKHDAAGAMADWKNLLDANPNYEQKDKVRQKLSEVEKQITVKPSTKS
jgi:cytochrome c-type biogenesis protein CcmH/NrfG